GHRTYKEQAADFLRDHVWRGDAITGFVKQTFFQDAALETAEPGPAAALPAPDPEAPPFARADPAFADRRLAPVDLGLVLDEAASGMAVGRWYPVRGN